MIFYLKIPILVSFCQENFIIMPIRIRSESFGARSYQKPYKISNIFTNKLPIANILGDIKSSQIVTASQLSFIAKISL